MVKIKKPIFLLIVIILGITAILAGGRFPYFFFYLSVLMGLVPFLWLSVGLRKITGDIKVSANRTEVGRSLVVRYTINNSSSGRFPYLELSNIVGSSFQEPVENKIVSLEAADSAVFEREVKCTRRGKYDMSEFQIKTGDPFGLLQLSKSLATGEKVIVYPKLTMLQEIKPSARQHFGDFNQKEYRFENHSLVSDLREWQVGDNIKKIHWKQTARQEKFVVKNYEKKGDIAPKIFLDMSKNSYLHDRNHNLEDMAVDTAASFLYYFLGNSIPVDLFSEPLHNGSMHGSQSGDFLEIMDRVIDLAPQGKTGYSTFVKNRSHYLASSGTLYLITPRLSFSDAAVLLSLKQKGFELVLFYLSSPIFNEEAATVLERLRENRVKVQSFYSPEVSKDESKAI